MTTTAPLRVPGYVAGTWTIDPIHSHVGFVIKHLMVSKVRGHFAAFAGEITTADNLLDSSVSATIEATSIDTNNSMRDDHIRSADFFDAENRPALTFVSSGLRHAGGEFFLDGNLTIRGTAQPVELAVEYLGETVDAYGGTRTGFSATTSISRKAYGVSFEAAFGAGNAVVADKVEIALELEFVKDAA